MGNGLGIASMIIGIVSNVLNWFVLTTLVALAIISGTELTLILAAVFGMSVLLIAIVGTILGIIGVIKNEKKVFAIVGLVLSAIVVVFVLFAMGLGAWSFLT